MIPQVIRRTAARKLGVVVDDFAALAGATDFIVSFADGAAQAAEGREVVLILRHEPRIYSPRGLVRGLRGLLRGTPPATVPTPEERLERLRGAGLPDLPVFVSERSEWGLRHLCRRNKIDVIGPLASPATSGFPIPSIGYIYDFQHRHLPMFFEPEEIEERDRSFARILERSQAVIVNSRAVKLDAEQFRPNASSHVVALPFSASPKPDWFAADPAQVCRRYGVGNRYFMVSNQFWLHKRHEVAIRAFARVVETDQSLELVLTGATSDHRAPRRLEDITGLIQSLGIGSRIHILGLIPKLDQIALVRGAIAIIQPTALEGGPGGGSVFDAVALGVPTVVSDLSVNREIAEHVTAYFPLDDVEGLARRLHERLASDTTALSPTELLRLGGERRRRQGHAIWLAADLALRRRMLGG